MNYQLDFSGKLPVSAQVGMETANRNASPEWRHIFDACVLAAARRLREVTADDVLWEIEQLPDAPSTHNLSAIGPAMKRAAEMGILRRLDRVVRSKRPEKRGNFHAVWLSNYYQGRE